MAGEFPESAALPFALMTQVRPGMREYLRVMRKRPKALLAERMEVLKNTQKGIVSEDDVDFTIRQDSPMEWAEHGLDDGLDEVKESNPGQGTSPDILGPNRVDVIEDEVFILIEDLSEEVQTALLDLKSSLHNQETHVEVAFILDLQGDDLSCVADELSRLPTEQVTQVLRAFMDCKENLMLQRDLDSWFKNFLLKHLDSMECLPDASLLSHGEEIARRWPDVFLSGLLLPSVLRDRSRATASFMKQSLRSMDETRSSNAINALITSLIDGRSPDAAGQDDRINITFEYAGEVVQNCSTFGADLIDTICSLFDGRVESLKTHRVFVKCLLDIVKRTEKSALHDNKRLGDLIEKLNHPLKNILKKLTTQQ